jgi:uncharacterized protein
MTDEVRVLAATMNPSSCAPWTPYTLASALTLGEDLAGVLTYDHRMADAARARDITVLAPS